MAAAEMSAALATAAAAEPATELAALPVTLLILDEVTLPWASRSSIVQLVTGTARPDGMIFRPRGIGSE